MIFLRTGQPVSSLIRLILPKGGLIVWRVLTDVFSQFQKLKKKKKVGLIDFGAIFLDSLS